MLDFLFQHSFKQIDENEVFEQHHCPVDTSESCYDFGNLSEVNVVSSETFRLYDGQLSYCSVDIIFH